MIDQTQQESQAFFVPGANDEQDSEKILKQISRLIDFPISKRKIQSIQYALNRLEIEATVGELLPHQHRAIGTIVAIFYRPGLYAICAKGHGLDGGKPLLVPESTVRMVKHFR